MDLRELESEICKVGVVFGDLLHDHALNIILLELVIDNWPVDTSDRSRKGLQRRVRDAYCSRFKEVSHIDIEPVIRALVCSTIWWYDRHPDKRDVFVGRWEAKRGSRCC